MDWYCAEYTEEKLYELHDGQTATGLEELDDLLMQTIDPILTSELEGMTDKDHTAWMQALRKQQTFRTRQVPRWGSVPYGRARPRPLRGVCSSVPRPSPGSSTGTHAARRRCRVP